MTLLIVEDEKAIRAGIRAMVSRAPARIESILECKNGEEAMEILRNQHVDVMITDIRMPRMDGIELVSQARELPSPPITIVVSGHGDFNYAISTFRDGVRDYLLKPIERERVFALLADIQSELDEKDREAKNRISLMRHAFRSLILGGTTDTEDLRALSSQYCSFLLDDSYIAICLSSERQGSIAEEIQAAQHYLMFPEVDSHTVLLLPMRLVAELEHVHSRDRCAGLSTAKHGLEQLREAYMEASHARKCAFILGSTQKYVKPLDLDPKSREPTASTEKIAQLLGAGNDDEAIRLLEQTLFLAQNDRIPHDDYLSFIDRVLKNIVDTYSRYPQAGEDIGRLSEALSFESAFEHLKALSKWLSRLSGYVAETRKSQTIQHMNTAIDYIARNFRSDINMATTSNHVSMNYSQFSTLFKKHTGVSFPEYLLNIRLTESRRLLSDPSLSIASVSKMSGFKNEKHFMRCFKQVVGVSPGEYRRNL